MPVNYYPQLDETALLELLTALQNRATKGQAYRTAAAGVETSRSFEGSAKVHVEIRRVLWSLHLLDPVVYPDPYADRIRRTRARYLFS